MQYFGGALCFSELPSRNDSAKAKSTQAVHTSSLRKLNFGIAMLQESAH